MIRYGLMRGSLCILMAGASNTALAQEKAAAPATAAEQQDSAQPGNFGDIIVTAQRRAENIQDVPVAVSAFTPDMLTRQGVFKAQDLARVTPSLQVSRFVGSPTAVSFGIRGQRTNDVRMNAESAVVTYIADVPQHLPFGIGLTGFLDLASVQVLRGPQGTLFGKNSTGGAVLLTPNTPTDNFEGSFRLTVGNFDKIEGQAVANIPLGEGIGLRFAGIAGKRNAFIKNRAFNDLNSENYHGGRASFKIDKGDFSSTFYGDYLKFNGSGQAGRLAAVNPAGLAQFVPAGPGLPAVGLAQLQAIMAQNQQDFYSTSSTRPLYARTKVWGVSNTTTLQLSDAFTLKNIMGYRSIRNHQDSEANGTPFTLISSGLNSTGRQFSEELQAQFESGPVHLIGGVFYFKEKGDDQSDTESLRGLVRPIGGTLRALGAFADYNMILKNNSKSVFLEGTLDVTDKLHLTAGGRYTWDKRYRNGRNFNIRDAAYYPAPFAGVSCRFSVGGVPLPVDQCYYEGEVSFKKFTHNLTARYEFSEDQQVYASWRTGYRSGGFALEAVSRLDNLPYGPETVNTYEIGYKAKYELGADVGVRLNLAAYLSKYDDIQKNQSTRSEDGTQLVTRTVNAAKATIKGIEAEASMFFGDHLNFDLSYAYLDAGYDEWTVDSAAGPIDNSGIPWGYAPKHKVSASVRYTVPLAGESSLSFQPSISWQSRMFIEEIPGPGTVQPKYTLVNGRIEYAINQDLSLAAWGTNLFKKKYLVAGQNIYSALGYSVVYVGEPRMYGLELSAKF